MLVFFDESGHPHPNDSSSRPVLTAVCLSESDSHAISGRLHGLKRDILGREGIELKGVALLNRHTFKNKPDYVGFIEEFFSTLSNLPVTIFASIMEAPFPLPVGQTDILPNRFRFLLQRIELLAAESDTMATLMFDGSPNLYGGVGRQFNSFLYRSDEGRACTHITDAPAFVDSKTSAGIQIADMVASVIRQYEQANLFGVSPAASDLYLWGIRRWYRDITSRTRDDLVNHQGYTLRALHRMRVGET